MGLSKNYATTLYNWLSQFAMTFREPIISSTFQEINPNEYISYSAQTGNFGEQFIQPITIYSKSTGFTNLMNIVDNIESAISERGLLIREDWGNIVIYKGSPFYQDKPDEDESYRAGYINLLIKIYQK